MTHSGYTRVFVYLGLALTTLDNTPCYRSGRQRLPNNMVPPAYLDRSLWVFSFFREKRNRFDSFDFLFSFFLGHLASMAKATLMVAQALTVVLLVLEVSTLPVSDAIPRLPEKELPWLWLMVIVEVPHLYCLDHLPSHEDDLSSSKFWRICKSDCLFEII